MACKLHVAILVKSSRAAESLHRDPAAGVGANLVVGGDGVPDRAERHRRERYGECGWEMPNAPGRRLNESTPTRDDWLLDLNGEGLWWNSPPGAIEHERLLSRAVTFSWEHAVMDRVTVVSPRVPGD